MPIPCVPDSFINFSPKFSDNKLMVSPSGYRHLFVVIFFLFFPLLLFGKCQEGWTNIPPYYAFEPTETKREYYFLYGKTTRTGNVSKKQVTIGKIFEGYPEKSNYRLVKKNTLVRALHPVKSGADPKELVMVEILTDEENSKYLKGLIGTTVRDKKKSISTKGDRGFISPRSLKASSEEDILMVAKDSLMLKASNGLDEIVLKHGEGLKPIMSGDEYKVANCDGKFTYLFQILSKDSSRNMTEVEVGDVSCFSHQLVKEKQFEVIQKLIKQVEEKIGTPVPVEVNEWGQVRLPVDPEESYVHFTGPDPAGTDDWAEPDTLCALVDIAKKWKEECNTPGCTIQFGDLGFPTPAILDVGKDPLGHQQHSDGACVDMRPFRKDHKMEAINIEQSPKEYDKVRTAKFISLLLKNGATPVYFNDPSISKATNPGGKTRECGLEDPNKDEKAGVLQCAGHSDHIHFCLRKPNITGC